MYKFKSEESYQRWLYTNKKNSINSKKKALDRYYSNPNYCIYCGKIIEIKKGNRPAETKKKKFCNSSCSAKFNNFKRKKKYFCKNCGKNIIKKNAKNFCSQECWRFYITNEKITKWIFGEWDGSTKNGELSSIIRNYLLKENNYSCENCGWNKIHQKTKTSPLGIHHIDGNYKNNKRENLQVLCPNCHSLTDNYGSRNKGNGREQRYKK
jgi:predicted RNA-binding Zn-ribbon protein involved in translation (DUF1610 family)